MRFKGHVVFFLLRSCFAVRHNNALTVYDSAGTGCNFDGPGYDCCTPSNLCGLHEGGCNTNDDCLPGLECVADQQKPNFAHPNLKVCIQPDRITPNFDTCIENNVRNPTAITYLTLADIASEEECFRLCRIDPNNCRSALYSPITSHEPKTCRLKSTSNNIDRVLSSGIGTASLFYSDCVPGCSRMNTDSFFFDISDYPGISFSQCNEHCKNHPDCLGSAWWVQGQNCWIKHKVVHPGVVAEVI